MTTIADIKRAQSNMKRAPYRITAATMTNPSEVALWLREIALLEAHIRRYASAHNVNLESLHRERQDA